MAAAVNNAIMMPPNGIKSGNRTTLSNHTMPPSKVLHCRAVCAGCREQDLIQVVQRFGNISGIRLMPDKFQALVEFETLESAIACVTFSNIEPLVVRDRIMYVNYSKSSEISRKFNDPSKGQNPTHVLLMTVINVIHPVTVDTIRKICDQQNAEVQRIVFFHKNGLQALVEFKSVVDACQIQKALNGCDIYPGCCTLKVEFSNSSRLNVHSNTPEHYNIDIEQGRLRDSNTQDLFPNAEQYGATQSNAERKFGLFDKLEFPSSHNYDSSYQGGWNDYMGAMQPVQPNYLDQYASPFTDGVGSGGGEGCVAMAYGINNEVLNCTHLFNLFSLYGNVVKAKILVNKPGCAMVQYDRKLSTEMSVQNLNNLTLFGQRFEVCFSKHPYIVDNSREQATCFDGSPATVDFYASRNNRFKHVPGGRNDLFSMIHPPSVVLHYFNAPADCSKERLENLFETHSAEVPLKQLAIMKAKTKSTSGLLEFSSISKAVEALVLVNHVVLYKDDINNEFTGMDDRKRAPFTFKLAFSTSRSINEKDS